MERSLLTDILKTFSKAEFKEFVLFVGSPYFNREKVLQRFAEVLHDFYPDFERPNEEFFSALYPGKVYSDSLMRNIRSDMLRLAEKFLSVKGFLTSQKEVKKELVIQLSSRNLSKHSMKHLSSLRNMVDAEEIKDGDHYLDKFHIEREYYLLIQKSSDKYIRNETHDAILENLVNFFMINFIHQSTAELNRGKIITDSRREIPMLSMIDNILEGDGKFLLKVPYINMVYNVYKLLKEEDEKYFHELKKIIAEGMNGVSDDHKLGVYSAASNFAYLKVLSGDLRYIRDQYEIIMYTVKSGIHKRQKGHLPFVVYMNAVITGLEVDKIAEAEAFAEEYNSELIEEYRNSARHFCRGLISYKMKDYDDAVTELSRVVTEDFSFKQQIKSLYLKIYFDLNESEPFHFHTDSYKHFISENKMIHTLVRKQLSDYLKYAKKLFALKNSEDGIDKFELNKLTDEIKSSPSLINRKWLLEKADEIKNSKS